MSIMIKLFWFFVLGKYSICEALNYYDDNMSPLLLVHGVTRSKIEGKWSRTGEGYFCTDHHKDWTLLWFSSKYLVPPSEQCWADNMSLEYDTNTRKSSNRKGVITRVPGFGETWSMEYINDIFKVKKKTRYFKKIVEYFKDRGYNNDISIFGAPYDWRYAAHQQGEYFAKTAALIEKIVCSTNRRVVIVAHSMGGLMMRYFMTNQSPNWKAKHIKYLITVNTPWAGSLEVLPFYMGGNNFGVPTMKHSVARKAESTWQCGAWMLPSEELFGNTVLVKTAARSYTASQYQQFFSDLGDSTGYEIRKDVLPFTVKLSPPDVPMICIWSTTTDMETASEYNFKGTDMHNEDDMSTVVGEGDGTVPLRSLSYCERFKATNKYTMQTKVFQGLDHGDVVESETVLNYIANVLAEQPK